MGRDRWREGKRETGNEGGSAGQIRLRGFFYSLFFKHEIVSVLLKCMFEVGAQLNTSCLKKTDARVEQEMRERAKKEGGGSREDRKRSMRKKKKKTRGRNIWKEHEVMLQDKKNRWRETERRPPVVQGGCCNRKSICR